MSLMIANKSFRKKKLYKDYIISQGVIVNYKSWKFREVEFTIDGIKLEKKASMGIPFPSCGNKINANLDEIKKNKFPVIYSKEDNTNHEILIYKNQYKKVGLSIPDSLQEIVLKLSDCFCQK